MKINLENLRKADIKHKTPYFLFSKEKIKEQYKKAELICDKIVYPVKTNPDKKIISVLSSVGSSFLVSSLEEIKKVRNKKNIFLMTRNSEEKDLKNAFFSGIVNFIVDSNDSLVNLIKAANKKINVLLEFKSLLKIKSSYKKELVHGFNEKEIIKNLKKLGKIGHVRLGLHNHLISQNTSLGYWKRNLERILLLLEKIRKSDIKLDFLDLGGGIPIEYTKKTPSFTRIRNLLLDYFKKYRRLFPNLKIFLEPGRFIVGPSGVLITKVKFVKDNMAVVDCSVYTSLMDTLIVNLEVPCYTTSSKKEKTNYIIRGKSTCSLDVFRKNAKLNKLKKNDYIIFYNAGAYIFSSDFVDKKKPSIYTV